MNESFTLCVLVDAVARSDPLHGVLLQMWSAVKNTGT